MFTRLSFTQNSTVGLLCLNLSADPAFPPLEHQLCAALTLRANNSDVSKQNCIYFCYLFLSKTPHHLSLMPCVKFAFSHVEITIYLHFNSH